MCQLTYVCVQSVPINQILPTILSINSVKHSDGHGAAYKDEQGFKVEKSEYSGIYGGNLIPKTPVKEILLHVRKASIGTVSNENAHPFETERIILAHNGTLYGLASQSVPREKLKVKEKSKKEKGIAKNKRAAVTDSERFAFLFDKTIKDNPESSILENLQLSLEVISGKFAFIFIDKKTEKKYVVRGTDAELHKVPLLYNNKEVGYIINTEELPLYHMQSIFMSLTSFQLDLENIKELERFMLYEITTEGLKEVGKVSPPVVVTHTYFPRRGFYQYVDDDDSSYIPPASGKEKNSKIRLEKLLDMLDILDKSRLSIPELLLLIELVSTQPLQECKDWTEFEEINKTVHFFFDTHFTPKKLSLVNSICIQDNITLTDFHEFYCFPYFYLSEERLTNILERNGEKK